MACRLGLLLLAMGRSRLGHFSIRRSRIAEVGRVPRLPLTAVEELLASRPGQTLEEALDVFEVFASGALSDEIYVLDDVAGKRIAIAPTTFKDKHRRG